MTKSSRRLFDAVLIGLVFVLIVADLNIGRLHGASSLMLTMSLITWLMCSLPMAVLIGHCALSEE
jgi:hypothetical protein